LDDNANHQLLGQTLLENEGACQREGALLPRDVFDWLPGFGRALDKLATRLSHELHVTDDWSKRRPDDDEGLPPNLEQLFVLR
jgi:hypothetical protein